MRMSRTCKVLTALLLTVGSVTAAHAESSGHPGEGHFCTASAGLPGLPDRATRLGGPWTTSAFDGDFSWHVSVPLVIRLLLRYA